MKIVPRLGRHVARRLHLVFRIGNSIQHMARRVLLIVEIHFLEAALDDRLTIRGVVDDEIALVHAERLDFPAQETRTERVERAEPDLFRRIADEVVHALAHLRGCLVRERDGQDVPGRDAVREQVRDAAGQHLRLARARTRHDEQRSLAMLHGLFLHGIEPAENIVCIHV